MPATSILEDAASRYDVDTVRAVGQEISGHLMATAGSDQHARTAAVQGRAAVEFAADRVLARIGTDDEAEVAKLRLGSVVMVESAKQLAETAGRYASRGELRAEDGLALAYAQGDAQRAQEGSAA